MFGRNMDAATAGDRDTTRSATGRQIKFWIYGLAALLIAMSAASLTFIAHLEHFTFRRKRIQRFESSLSIPLLR